MAVRNAHWYSTNEGRSYPIDEIASGITDAGQRLRSNIIVDANLRWPSIYGRYAFLSSVAVTENLISLTIQAATDLDDATSFVPLAVVTVPASTLQGRQIAVLPQLAGVGGWVVFGAGIVESFRGRFSGPRQSVLTARAARAYRTLPVPSLRSQDAATALTGVITLRATEPLQIAAESREIAGVLRDCIVVRLVDDRTVDNTTSPVAKLVTTKDVSVFEQFGGPCAGRPESYTCGDPQPIEFINAVGPDCAGVLTLEFTGCAKVAQVQDTCGVVVDCGLGLVDACTAPQLPDSDGLLPSEREPINIPTPDDPTPEVPDTAISESVVVIGELPYVDCFGVDLPLHFQPISGLWSTVAAVDISQPCDATSAEMYAYSSATLSTRNITLWQGFDESTLGRKFITHFKIVPPAAGGKRNAGIIVNYREQVTGSEQYVYYLAEVDYDQQELRIVRFSGTGFQTAVAHSVYGVQLDAWYRLEVQTSLPSGPLNSQVSISVRLQSLDDASIDVTIGPLVVSNYLPSAGYFGLHANRSLVRFSNIQLEENT